MCNNKYRNCSHRNFRLKRKITLKEAARLQSFPTTFKFDENENQAYKQLGNSVNVKVIIKPSFDLKDKDITGIYVEIKVSI